MLGLMKRRRWVLLAVALVAIAAPFAWWATHPDKHEAHAQSVADPNAGQAMGGMTMGTGGTITISADVARSLGVSIASAELGSMNREVRTTGHVAYDETRLSTITTKYDGYAERLYVANTGVAVRHGQPVLEIYSPDLVAAQEELLAALRLERSLATSAAPGVADRSGRLAESARRKLALWDVSPQQIAEIERTQTVRRTLTLYAPFSGFVVDKQVQAGEAVRAGMPLYRLADLSAVWIEADVYEQDLRHVRLNAAVRVTLDAYPGGDLRGRVDYVYPDVQRETRTARVRIVLANAGGRIKPGMFATVHLDVPLVERAVLVPRDAVMRTGSRNLVFVETAPGVYEPRDVQPGAETGGRVQILSGLLAGERVVSRANFLLDAESRLMEGMTGAGAMPGMSH